MKWRQLFCLHRPCDVDFIAWYPKRETLNLLYYRCSRCGKKIMLKDKDPRSIAQWNEAMKDHKRLNHPL